MSKEEFAVCRSCGACCAYFRILLNWTEVEEFDPKGVPSEMCLRISEFLWVMKGTEAPPIRCIALEGEIGLFTTCKIYDRRGSLCREFNPSWYKGEYNEGCDNARKKYGLPPLPRPES